MKEFDWALSRNLGSPDIRDAWFEMMQTWRARGLLKAAAGVDPRGRDNWTPVLHYTLSWHADDKPAREHMQQAALDSLRMLGLSEHEAVVTAHTDKQHMHVHVVVNTVHPITGKTALLKFTKRNFSLWAEAYEREHGIHCEERVRNNEQRRTLAADRERESLAMLTAAADRQQIAEKRPYVPVKHKAANRKQWFERKDIIDRMKSMRATMDAEMKAARDVTWQRHSYQRDVLDYQTEVAIDKARKDAKETVRPQWRDLYRGHKKELRRVERMGGNPLERAVFVFANRGRLGLAGASLTSRQMLPLIASGKRLAKRLAQIHEQERRGLARQQKTETRVLTDALWQQHKQRFAHLRETQAAERQAERDQQAAQRKSISFEMAKAALAKEQQRAPEPQPEQRPIKRGPEPAARSQQFRDAAKPKAPAKLSRAEQIRRDMSEWKKKNPDRDPGREL